MGPENVSSRLAKAALRPSDDSKPALTPSKETLEEVYSFLKRFAEEVNGNEELSQSSKTMYIDFATCFVRWMYGGFTPGLPRLPFSTTNCEHMAGKQRLTGCFR